ncbi:hypothetical protein R3P38DRAFT_2812510 [Favolaschia claudopus]|uniref:Uncharacterized protein n=1 Tax=Favolaschia claudopus TaxID=2862362 RepID=A0AAV9Z722_9AGAR
MQGDSFTQPTIGSPENQESSPTAPLLSLDSAEHANTQGNGEASSVDSQVIKGWDLDLFILFIHGFIALCWGIALIILQTGIVPISSSLSQYGLKHTIITNVIITAVANIFTLHLKFTVKHVIGEYLAMAALAGIDLQRWCVLEGVARVGMKGPFEMLEHRLMTVLWITVVAGMGAHSASQVAILQPESWVGHVLYNDSIPCGVDPGSLTLSSTLIPHRNFDRIAFQLGMQLGYYYDQVAGNTSTAVGGQAYVKDNFAYSGLGVLADGRYEVPGAQIIAWCGSNDHHSYDANPSSLWLPLEGLWSTAFPQHDLPNVKIENEMGSFSPTDNINSPMQASITSGPNFSLADGRVGLYGLINATGSGGILTVDHTGAMVGCVWALEPKLVHVQRINGTSVAVPQLSTSTGTVPFPNGRGMLAAVQGMAAAVEEGAHLVYDPALGGGVDVHILVETLLADALKGVFTAYMMYSQTVGLDPARTGAGICFSGNRTDEYYLGWIAIVFSIVIGLIALGAAVCLRFKPRVKGIDLLQVADAFTLGVHTTDTDIDHWQRFRLKNGMSAEASVLDNTEPEE